MRVQWCPDANVSEFILDFAFKLKVHPMKAVDMAQRSMLTTIWIIYFRSARVTRICREYVTNSHNWMTARNQLILFLHVYHLHRTHQQMQQPIVKCLQKIHCFHSRSQMPPLSMKLMRFSMIIRIRIVLFSVDWHVNRMPPPPGNISTPPAIRPMKIKQRMMMI